MLYRMNLELAHLLHISLYGEHGWCSPVSQQMLLEYLHENWLIPWDACPWPGTPAWAVVWFPITQRTSTWIKMKRANWRGGGKWGWVGNPIVLVCSFCCWQKALWNIETECYFLAFPPPSCTHTDKFLHSQVCLGRIWAGTEFSFKKNKGPLVLRRNVMYELHRLITFKKGVLSQAWWWPLGVISLNFYHYLEIDFQIRLPSQVHIYY